MAQPPINPTLAKIFRKVIALRWWIVGVYLALLGPATYFALQVKQDNALDRLIVQTDPLYMANRDFEAVFGHGEFVLVVLEADDPYSPEFLKRVDATEQALNKVPKCSASSLVGIWRSAKGGFDPATQSEAMRKFGTGSTEFKRQGLVGDKFLSVSVVMDVRETVERQKAIDGLDAVLKNLEKDLGPISHIAKVGQPFVNAYLDEDTKKAGTRYFPLFIGFVIVLNIALYRSWRTLLAFLIALGANAALTNGYVGVTGGIFTIVSSLVPMTILISNLATLVYLHSRFVDKPEDIDVDDHQIFSLCNKFMATTVSLFATAVGFAALAVSKIRPIRELGIWVAVGLVFTWLIVFTLFPALQKILRTPTQAPKQPGKRSAAFVRFTEWLPVFTYRFRWLFVPGALVMCVVGAVCLFGVPGYISPMKLETNAVEYFKHDSFLYKDTKRLEAVMPGLGVSEIWLKGKFGVMTDADTIRGLDIFSRELEADKRVGAVVGVPSILRTIRYLSGEPEVVPTDPAELEALAGRIETLMGQQALLSRFILAKSLDQTHMTIITQTLNDQSFAELQKLIDEKWKLAVQKEPALGKLELKVAGLGPLQARLAGNLVGTLVESFVITAVIIFLAFLVVFRNGPARLMAMIPSLFAILVMFAFMRVTGIALNIATILIATTVLGTSENDQIHFFYHFTEKKNQGASTHQALVHTLQVAGRAIFYATLINAGGFCAFALADLAPIKQFGLLSAVALLLSMIADFTALPAALWMVFRDKPDDAAPPATDAKLPEADDAKRAS